MLTDFRICDWYTHVNPGFERKGTGAEALNQAVLVNERLVTYYGPQDLPKLEARQSNRKLYLQHGQFCSEIFFFWFLFE
jgi:hypothetical protein